MAGAKGVKASCLTLCGKAVHRVDKHKAAATHLDLGRVDKHKAAAPDRVDKHRAAARHRAAAKHNHADKKTKRGTSHGIVVLLPLAFGGLVTASRRPLARHARRASDPRRRRPKSKRTPARD